MPDAGRFYAPYIPRERSPKLIDPNDFSLRKGLRSRLFPAEPSAVDQLAALADPDGDAGRRVEEWKNRPKWKVYVDPGHTATIAVDNL